MVVQKAARESLREKKEVPEKKEEKKHGDPRESNEAASPEADKPIRLCKREKKEQKYQRLKEKYRQKKTKRKRKKKAPEGQEISNYKIYIEVVGGLELMTEKEMRSLSEQIRYVYASNRIAYRPVQLIISNALLLKGYLRDYVSSWSNIRFMDESICQMKTLDVVVLSADAEDTITEMNENTIYMIGGLVDRNRHKGYIEKMYGQKFRTVKLPITQKLSSSKVLSTLHVFKILQTYTEIKDWEAALKMHLPVRKQVVELNEKEHAPNTLQDSAACGIASLKDKQS